MTGPEKRSSTAASVVPVETAGAWIQCSFDVEVLNINASVKRFDHDERHRIASEVAWFAQGILMGAEPRTVGWPEFLQRMLTYNVAITLDEEGLQGTTSFWRQVVCRGFEVLMIANGLDPAIIARMWGDQGPDCHRRPDSGKWRRLQAVGVGMGDGRRGPLQRHRGEDDHHETVN